MNNITSSPMRFLRSYDSSEVEGLKVKMKTTNPMHIGEQPQVESPDNVTKSFADFLLNAFNKVNQHQLNATHLQQVAITNPEKVNLHSAMNAIAKAEMSLGLMKSVSDRLINAFRELENPR